MKPQTKWLTLLIVLFTCLASFFVPVNAQAQNPPDMNGDQLVLGRVFTLLEGQNLNGSLLVIGGTAELNPNSKISGDVLVIGGTVTINGTIQGDLSVYGGTVQLLNQATIYGDFSDFGGSTTQEEGAKIYGRTTSALPFNLTLNADQTPLGQFKPNIQINDTTNSFGKVFWAIFQSLALAVLALLTALLLPKHTERVTNTISTQPVVSGSIGLLTLVIFPLVLILLIVTIILSPVGVIGILAFALAILFGWIGLGLWIGQKIAGWFKSEFALPVKAGVGSLILTIIARLVAMIPCVGWLFGFVLAMIGLGAVVLTRFGVKNYPEIASEPEVNNPKIVDLTLPQGDIAADEDQTIHFQQTDEDLPAKEPPEEN